MLTESQATSFADIEIGPRAAVLLLKAQNCPLELTDRQYIGSMLLVAESPHASGRSSCFPIVARIVPPTTGDSELQHPRMCQPLNIADEAKKSLGSTKPTWMYGWSFDPARGS